MNGVRRFAQEVSWMARAVTLSEAKGLVWGVSQICSDTPPQILHSVQNDFLCKAGARPGRFSLGARFYFYRMTESLRERGRLAFFPIITKLWGHLP